ncbi:MAG: hypothetical protein M3Y28_01410 [Armatimonadota bacterium]|nr:hypothetical protein [Armatimonadota bacterium]
MPTEITEERRQALEREIEQIRARYPSQHPDSTGRTAPDFLDNYVGIFADSPMFEEMVRFTEEERERNRREARGETETENTGA